MNSAFEKLKIASEESVKNMSDELVILKPKLLLAIDQIREKKKRSDIDSIYVFNAHTCVSNVSKGLIELIIEELKIQNKI